MSDDSFYRLSPFIQEYIYAHKWTELRAVQIEACRVIFDTDNHLLLSSGTASGKTEAAFLPILTLLSKKPSTSLGILYISPLKALINDQFERLTDLLKESEIPVWHWHGDVNQSHKNKFLKEAKGLLQITPESMESLLMNRQADMARLFGDLRFIVIDEVHAFMRSERGIQILCQLKRLSKFMNSEPRRIGLSATLGNYKEAEEWLSSGTDRKVSTPIVETGKRTIRISVEHFSQESEKVSGNHLKYIFDYTKSKKCIIFTNNRGDAESVISSLREIALSLRMPDIYHVHHGSISRILRESAELSLKGESSPSIVAATLTLELGIDIGQLERIFQLGAPFSVSSFLQRLGRSGRRGQPSEMWFVCNEESHTKEKQFYELIPWDLIQTIAVIQLYLEEKWLEPTPNLKYPFSLLYHQTMSILSSSNGLRPSYLAQSVLTLPPFKEISQNDYKELLIHLIELNHIQKIEDGSLILGLDGEKVVRNFKFYAVFQDIDDFKVKEGVKSIGSINRTPPVGENFLLAGRSWKVMEIDEKRKVIYVKLVTAPSSISWSGDLPDIHKKVLEKIRQILLEDTHFKYLQGNAQKRLKDARIIAEKAGLYQANIIYMGGQTYCMIPWVGSKSYYTLIKVVKYLIRTSDNLRNIDIKDYDIPKYIILSGVDDISILFDEISVFIKSENIYEKIIEDKENLQFSKYDEFIPQKLLKKAYIADHLNFTEIRELLDSCNFKIIGLPQNEAELFNSPRSKVRKS